jgi:hypothetical protein
MKTKTDLPELSSGIVELNAGVDALYASSRQNIPSALYQNLFDLRQKLSNGTQGSYIIDGVLFQVGERGWGKYSIFLEHEFGRIGFTASHKIPGVRLQVRAEYLHAVGPQNALDWFTQILEAFGVTPQWTLSRIDLFVDIQGWDLNPSDEPRFLCRASQVAKYEDRGVLTGFAFGRRSSKTISGRIYDKTIEIAKEKNYWVPMLWNEKYDPQERVLGVEFELATKVLHELGIRTLEEALHGIGALWGYCSDDWLTFRDPGDDSNKSRWPLSADWTSIQNISMRGNWIGLERIRGGNSASSIDGLLPGLRGYLSSMGALFGSKDLDSSIKSVQRLLALDENRSGISMVERLQEKRLRFGL